MHPTLPKRSWLHQKASVDHQEFVQQVCWRRLRPRPSLMAVMSHTTWQQDIITRWTTIKRQLKTTLPSIIRPAPNNKAVRTSLQSRKVYSRYYVHAKKIPQLLATQPVRLQEHSPRNHLSKERSYPELRPPFHIWSKHKKVLQKE